MSSKAGPRIAISVAAVALLATTTRPAHADGQTYLDYLLSHGFQYHVNVETPDRAVQFGKNICLSLHYDGDPISRIDKKISGSVDDVMVDAAQHELCPDTLSAPHKPLPEYQRDPHWPSGN